MVRHRKSSAAQSGRRKMEKEMSHTVSSTRRGESVDGMGEPSLSMGKSPNAPRLATPQGSLSTPSWGVSPKSDSPPCVCTPPSVPPPPCGAGQTTTTDSSPYVCASPKAPLLPCYAVVSESVTKVARNNLNESQTESLNESQAESLNESSTESLTKLKTTIQRPSSTTQCVVKVVQGNFHQGDPFFGINAGRQCVANCLSAASYNKLKNVNNWTPTDLDFILQIGDELYSYLQSSTTLSEEFLLIRDLPTVLDIRNHSFTFTYVDPVVSLIQGNLLPDYHAFNALPIGIALQEALIEADSAFVCFGGNTMLIGKTSQGYFIFDSHSRSDIGMLHPSGSSICIMYSSVEALHDHFQNLAISMGIFNPEQLEITAVKVNQLQHDATDAQKSIYNAPLDMETEKRSSKRDPDKNKHDSLKRKKDDDPVIFMCETSTFCPSPISQSDRRRLCGKLKLKLNPFNKVARSLTQIDCLDKTFDVHETIADGNCFFRSVACAVSLSEECHLAIRTKVVEHALSHADVFRSILRQETEPVSGYISRCNMNQTGTWATEFEIIATAHLLGCDIYTLQGQTWLKYSGSLVDTECPNSERSILLHHVRENHYNAILKAHTKLQDEPISSSTRGLEALFQKKNKKREAKEKDRQRKAQKRQKIEKKEHVNRGSKDYMALYMKKKYEGDSAFRQQKKQKGIELYKLNAIHRDEVKQRSIQKYKENELHRKNVKHRSVRRYHDDELHRQNVIQRSVRKYKGDESHRHNVKQRSARKYKDDESHRQNVKQRSVRKYRDDESHRQNVIQRSVRKYRDDESHRQNVIQRSVRKYRDDESHRQNVIQRSVRKYRDDESFRKKKKSKGTDRYLRNEAHRESQKQKGIQKYRLNKAYRISLKQKSLKKYRENEKHRLALKQRNKQKYRNNPIFRAALKARNLKKYKSNALYRARLKKYNRDRYRTDETLRHNIKTISIQRYYSNVSYRRKVNERYNVNRRYRLRKLALMRKKYEVNVFASQEYKNLLQQKTRDRRSKCLSNMTFDDLIRNFRSKSMNGPTCVCESCKRTLFDTQVLKSNVHAYKNIWSGSSKTEDVDEQSKNQWVCKTCHRKLKQGSIPAEAETNGLKLTPIPEELKNLNSLEHHLIAQHIPFMKVISLPKGGQNAIQGPVVCVPANISKSTKLPRRETDDCLLKVKLKRKLVYKGHYEYQCINPKRLTDALDYLKKNNQWYSGITYNTYTSSETEENERLGNAVPMEDTDESDTTNATEIEEENGVQYDTCLQPADIGQEVLDHHFDEIYHLAPAEGNNPVKMLQEEGNEAKTFPKLFPDGKSTFDEEREIRLTLARYFNNRLMNADNRFARDTNYIFFAQYVSELKQVIDKTQISLRKTNACEEADTKSLKNVTELKRLLRNDEALRFMQPIRGTPSYWQLAQKDLFAMLRQLGIPTWFCSFSAAEFRWKEIVCAIMEQLGDDRQFEDLDWTEKSYILQSNPVTVARMFDTRFHTFFREVIMSKKGPIGKVIDFFFRIEFQQRGSPHMHCLFWIENAPSLEQDGEQAVCDFVDQYVTCSTPLIEQDHELHEIVQSVQQHSKNHSKSCRKKGTTCRFNFPRPPSARTFITKEMSIEDREETEGCSDHAMSKSQAMIVLQRFWDAVSSNSISSSNLSVTRILQANGLSQQMFEEALSLISLKRSLVLRRNIYETWTNPYNPTLLKAWNANMDIQYVLDPYSCIVYIISYISKAEKEMGMILKQTESEAREGNKSAKQTMKSIGSAYLHHREVGVQEAVYRVCSLRMKECSRKVVFIPTGENPTRLSKPLSQIKPSNTGSNDQESDEETIWMTNIVDRYYDRPNMAEFNQMCLAQFAAVFRVLAKSQIPTKPNVNVFRLLNEKGYIQRRTKSDLAIIRYFRASLERTPELYHQTMLQLYLPHRCLKHLKPDGFELYQNFYETGYVRIDENIGLCKVQTLVDTNKAQFVKNEDTIDAAVSQVEELGPIEDAWAQICPETEIQRQECIEMRTEDALVDPEIIPEFEDEQTPATNLTFISESIQERDRIIPILQSLNTVQKDIFYHIRDWCLQNVNVEEIPPFHLFVTGGAGTGKSHLIKAVEYEAKRLLLKSCSQPDNQTVLLTAFTGTAAFNIGGCTIHHALKLQRGLPFPYEPLTEQVLSPLRFLFQDLKILVIDEVSMIYKRLLYYIHERLVQIMRKKEPFGGVSILAVGDFYQLPPVKQKKAERLLSDADICVVDLWNERFSIVELNEIMRQKDDVPFAKMLHTLRTRTREQALPRNVVTMLKACEREAPSDVLHVYSTNEEVNNHNREMIRTLSSEIHEVPARDFKKDKTSGKLNLLQSPRITSENDSLPSLLLLATNARVMLTRNVDVSDGLANGVVGTVIDFKYEKATGEQKIIHSIGIEFDNANVGLKTRINKSERRVVYLTRVEDDIRKVAIIRHQFPLRLAWACTTHKVQGMTVDAIAVDLKKVFSPGQSYVALSRVTSQSGLFICNADEKLLDAKIFADSDISSAMANMHQFDTIIPSDIQGDHLILMNIQSLSKNIENLACDTRFHKSNAICLTETWLQKTSNTQPLKLNGYEFHNVSREECYTANSLLELQSNRGGGVGVYVKNGSGISISKLPVTDLEGILLHCNGFTVVTIYRPQICPVKHFLQNLCKLLETIETDEKTIIVMGDFNENILREKGQIQEMMEERSYTQHVHGPTTDGWTLIDHVYSKRAYQRKILVLPTYYSYHNALVIPL